jgi:hypothetical protein
MGESELSLDWPIDLGLTVASHGWVHLEPWRWQSDSGRLEHTETIGGERGVVAVRQRGERTLVVDWQGFGERAAAEILRRVQRWVSAEWDPAPALAALAAGFPEEAAIIARGGGRLLRASTL